MADNYLERRFEEHERQSVVSHRRHVIRKQRKLFFVGAVNEIGAAVIRSMCAMGHRVAFCSSDEESAHNLASHTGAIHINIDAYDAHALQSAFDEFVANYGDVDIVIYNGWQSSSAEIENASIGDFAERVARETTAMLLPIQKMAQNRIAKRVDAFGRIVCIKSNTTDVLSAAVNGAVASVAQHLSESLKPYGVSVNAITPKNDTTPEEVARLCRFLVDDANGFVTGKDL